MQLLAVEIGAAPGVVHPEFSVDKHRTACRRPRVHNGKPPLGHPKPRQQLLHREGLCQVVVRAGIQSVNLVAVLAAGTDHNDGHIGPGTDILDDLNAVHVRKSQVQQDNVRIVGRSFHNGCFSIGRHQVAVVIGS